MKTGEVIQYIRTSKCLKSKDVYANILSRPVISKFEKGISDTTTEKFFLILQNLNVTLDEFYYIYNDFREDTDTTFFTNYAKAFYSTDREHLNVLFDELEDEYELTHQVKYLHYSLLAELTLKTSKDSKHTDESLNVLQNYLLNCDDWTYYELVLFTNLIDFFSFEVINVLYKRAKKKLIYFNKIKKYRNELFSLITNILVLHIEENDTALCKFYYSELTKNASDANNLMYEKTMLIFFKELLNIMETQKYNSITIDKIIDFFDFLDLPFRKQQCIELLNLVEQNNNLCNSASGFNN